MKIQIDSKKSWHRKQYFKPYRWFVNCVLTQVACIHQYFILNSLINSINTTQFWVVFLIEIVNAIAIQFNERLIRVHFFIIIIIIVSFQKSSTYNNRINKNKIHFTNSDSVPITIMIFYMKKKKNKHLWWFYNNLLHATHLNS